MNATKRFASLFLIAAVLSSAQSPRTQSTKEILAAHNALRARSKLPSLIWSNELARYAQEWADRLVEAGRLVHRPNPIYGENLFLIHGADVSPAAVVGAWASEARNYSYQTNSCQGRCGHYTQLIWRDTKRVGCGAASRDGTEVWVCNYDPPGNIAGERPY
jgi:pathogenesis-related protein 1